MVKRERVGSGTSSASSWAVVSGRSAKLAPAASTTLLMGRVQMRRSHTPVAMKAIFQPRYSRGHHLFEQAPPGGSIFVRQGGSSFHISTPLTKERRRARFKKAEVTLQEFRNLSESWDSYGTRPIKPQNVRAAIHLLRDNLFLRYATTSSCSHQSRRGADRMAYPRHRVRNRGSYT